MLRKKKPKPLKQPSEPLPPPELSAAEDYALDLDDEAELDEVVQQEPVALFDGPGNWEEVDVDDVQRIALNISRSAVPAAENAEVASRLAMQAAALEADNLDPLGLGRIDSRQLTLAHASRGGMTRPLMSRAQVGRGAYHDELNRPQSDARTMPASMAQLRIKIMPTSEKFEPEVFLGTIHGETMLNELLSGRHNLHNEMSERTGQLKSLVKENFDRFISCKNTIDDIHTRLRKAEKSDSADKGDDDSGASTADVVESVAEVQQDARWAFASMLERAAMSDRIQNVASVVKRYEGLFRLPGRIKQYIAAQQFDQVTGEYRKAKQTVTSLAASSRYGVWNNLGLEIDKAMEAAAAALQETLQSPNIDAAAASDAIKHLLSLQAVGLQSIQSIDPVKMYIERQAVHIEKLIMKAEEDRLLLLKEADAQLPLSSGAQASTNLDTLLGQHHPSLLPDDLANTAGSDTDTAPDLPPWSAAAIWLRYVARLTQIVAQHLPDLWLMSSEQLTTLATVSDRAKQLVDGSVTLVATSLRNILERYRVGMGGALQQLGKSSSSPSLLLALVREVVSGCCSLQFSNAPKLVISSFQQLLEEAVSISEERLQAQQEQIVACLDRLEDWTITTANHKTGQPVSRLPNLLQQVVIQGMDQLQALLSQAMRCSMDLQGAVAEKSRAAFFQSFTVFAIAAEKLAAQVTAPRSADNQESEGVPIAVAGSPVPSTDARLLTLYSNCQQVRLVILPNLCERYGELLAADGGGSAARTSLQESSQHIQQVEAQLLQAYVDVKTATLDDALQDFLPEPEAAVGGPLPTTVGAATHELINALAAVEAEMYQSVPSMRASVLDAMMDYILGAVTSVVTEQLADVPPASLLQLLLDLTYLQRVVQSSPQQCNSSDFAAAIDTLVQRCEIVIKQTSSREIKSWMDPSRSSLPLSQRILRTVSSLASQEVQRTRMNAALLGSQVS